VTKSGEIAAALVAVSACLVSGVVRAAEVDPSMVLYMPFDDIGADRATDYSDAGNHGDLKGGAEVVEDEGAFFGALVLEPNAYVEVPGDGSLNLQDMTLMCWVRLDADPGDQSAIERTSGWGAGEYNLLGDYGNAVLLQIFDLDDGCDDELQAGNVLDGEWRHIAATYDSSEIVVYVDGDDVGGGPCDGEIAEVATPLYIGSRGGGSRFTHGAYDEIRIYNRAMSKDEINLVMNEGPVELLAVDARDRVAVTWGTLKSGVPAFHE